MNWMNKIKPAPGYIILCAIIVLGLVFYKNPPEKTGTQIIYVDNRHIENYINKQAYADYTQAFESDTRTVYDAGSKHCNKQQ